MSKHQNAVILYIVPYKVLINLQPGVCDSALLNALDACSAGAVVRLGVERNYMSQLLLVQRARGATGGHAFASTLRLQPPTYMPGMMCSLILSNLIINTKFIYFINSV